jgi:glycosyltransferase involved in cell wall biosynthesis
VIRVLHISTFHLSGGAGLAASRLNRAINKTGGKSMLLVAKGSEEEAEVFPLDRGVEGKLSFWLRFIKERLFFLFYEKNKAVRYAFSPAVSGKDLTGHPLVRQADVIHLHWFNFGLLSVRDIQAILALDKPVIWTMHDMWAFTGGCHYAGDCRRFESSCGECRFLRNPGKRDLSHRRLLDKKNRWRPGAGFVAVACSGWLEKEARASDLLKPFELTNIPNAIDTTLFRPLDKGLARADLGLENGKFFLLFAAASVASPLKGFDFLLTALNVLLVRRPDLSAKLELLIIGGGDDRLLKDIPLKAHYLGYIRGAENLVKVYNAATLYVTPSLEDNLPNTVMEALACGTPVTGFRTGGIPEMIDHLRNGFVADYKSPESLAEGIRWVIENHSQRNLSEAARKKAMDTYDEKIVASRYLELYARKLDEKKKSQLQ